MVFIVRDNGSYQLALEGFFDVVGQSTKLKLCEVEWASWQKSWKNIGLGHENEAESRAVRSFSYTLFVGPFESPFIHITEILCLSMGYEIWTKTHYESPFAHHFRRPLSNSFCQYLYAETNIHRNKCGNEYIQKRIYEGTNICGNDMYRIIVLFF
jgi:hypothetical protein